MQNALFDAVPAPVALTLARYFITIDTDADEVEIIDVLGRMVRRANGTDVIDVSDLSVGVYVVRAGRQSTRFTIRR